ncbi:hypothetical protein [Streptomyces sp. NPDC048419]|uniref:hypothetical protein n=1 Tax=Streptomyces sp. NPDC048419 TaxID=3365547 RepID=UPI003720E60F
MTSPASGNRGAQSTIGQAVQAFLQDNPLPEGDALPALLAELAPPPVPGQHEDVHEEKVTGPSDAEEGQAVAGDGSGALFSGEERDQIARWAVCALVTSEAASVLTPDDIRKATLEVLEEAARISGQET